jgi:hypothetical protein
MKLNINAKELVALHNLLHSRLNDEHEYKEEDPRAVDEVQLRQVYNRLRACMIAALTNKQIDPVDAFLQREQAKINKLNDQNEAVKKDQASLAATVKNDPDFFVPNVDETYDAPEYPRRGSRSHRGNRGNNKR